MQLTRSGIAYRYVMVTWPVQNLTLNVHVIQLCYVSYFTLIISQIFFNDL